MGGGVSFFDSLHHSWQSMLRLPDLYLSHNRYWWLVWIWRADSVIFPILQLGNMRLQKNSFPGVEWWTNDGVMVGSLGEFPKVKAFHQDRHHLISTPMADEWTGIRVCYTTFIQTLQSWTEIQACHLVSLAPVRSAAFCEYICMWVHMHIYMCVWRPEVNVGSFPSAVYLFIYFR